MRFSNYTVSKKTFFAFCAGLFLMIGVASAATFPRISNPPSEVVPGDVLTSDNFNKIVDGLAQLDARTQSVYDLNGKVGIGKTDPAATLDVNGNINTTGFCLGGDCKTTWSQIVTAGGGGADLWSDIGGKISYILGNVGIGTTTPGQKLSINGSGTGEQGIGVENGTGGLFLRSGSDGYGIIESKTSQPLYIRGNGGNVLINDSAGNVGIGTTTPGQKLSVAGVVESTSGGFKFPDGTILTTATGVGSGGSSGGAASGGYDVQVFNSSGTWTKPTGAPDTAEVRVECIGGGGGGVGWGSGGGGGTYAKKEIKMGAITTPTVAVTVGAGGAGALGTSGALGGNGENSTFGSYLTAYGGGGGVRDGTGRSLGTGGGGGQSSGSSIGGAGSTGGGGGGSGSGGSGFPNGTVTGGGNGIYGGGGGGYGAGVGGNSVYGGGGGGAMLSGFGSAGNGGTSVYGGGGGNHNGSGNGYNGTAPGGGGGAGGNSPIYRGGAGAAGRCTITTIWGGGSSLPTCTTNQTLKYNGTTWTCVNSTSDTLAGLTCSTNQIAKWNGSAWACAADNTGGTTAISGETQLGPQVWSGERGSMTYDAAMTHCANYRGASGTDALGTWYLPTITDWDIAKARAGGASALVSKLGLTSNQYYRTSSIGTGSNNAYLYRPAIGNWNSSDVYNNIDFNLSVYPYAVRCLKNS